VADRRGRPGGDRRRGGPAGGRARHAARPPSSLDRIAAAEGAAIAHPLLDAAVWARVPRGGFASRSEGMRHLFGDVLPARVLSREHKACFDEVFCGPHAHAAAAAYDGTGAPPHLVDPAALRGHWAGGSPRPQSLLLLQAAALGKTGHPASTASRATEHNTA
jgi:hypothetical protein